MDDMLPKTGVRVVPRISPDLLIDVPGLLQGIKRYEFQDPKKPTRKLVVFESAEDDVFARSRKGRITFEDRWGFEVLRSLGTPCTITATTGGEYMEYYKKAYEAHAH